MTNHPPLLFAIALLLASRPAADIIPQTCRACASAYHSLSYRFCVTSLCSVPLSRHTDSRGLALIAMELAIINVSGAASAVEGMIRGGGYDRDPVAMSCLRGCLRLYREAGDVLLRGAGEFVGGEFGRAGRSVGQVAGLCRECEEGFEKGGVVFPLEEENYDLVQLCDIALCIIAGNLSTGQGLSVI